MTAEIETKELASIVGGIDHTPLKVEKPTLTLMSFTDPAIVAEYTNVPDVDSEIDKAIREQSGRLFYLGAQNARAQQQYANTKLSVDILEASLYQKHRDALSAEGKVTEKQIEAAVLKDSLYAQAMLRLSEAKAHADIAASAVEAMRHQRDTLMVRANDRRAEFKGEMRITAATQQAELLQTLANQRKAA